MLIRSRFTGAKGPPAQQPEGRPHPFRMVPTCYGPLPLHPSPQGPPGPWRPHCPMTSLPPRFRPRRPRSSSAMGSRHPRGGGSRLPRGFSAPPASGRGVDGGRRRKVSKYHQMCQFPAKQMTQGPPWLPPGGHTGGTLPPSRGGGPRLVGDRRVQRQFPLCLVCDRDYGYFGSDDGEWNEGDLVEVSAGSLYRKFLRNAKK